MEVLTSTPVFDTMVAGCERTNLLDMRRFLLWKKNNITE